MKFSLFPLEKPQLGIRIEATMSNGMIPNIENARKPKTIKRCRVGASEYIFDFHGKLGSDNFIGIETQNPIFARERKSIIFLGCIPKPFLVTSASAKAAGNFNCTV